MARVRRDGAGKRAHTWTWCVLRPAPPIRTIREPTPPDLSQLVIAAADLIERGYFPREIPPVFNPADLAALVRQPPPGMPTPSKQWTACTRHNLARSGGFRRPLGIPNPRGFLPLADVFESNWLEIANHLYVRRFSRSRPTIYKNAERALSPRLAFGELSKVRVRTWRGCRYILKADISQFYSSLYTHSIPWAIHTKATAKARKRQRQKALAGDRIDEAMRNICQGQTVGIPIGPDTSLAAAEIVLTAVDDLLHQELGGLRGHRYIDDYEMPFTSLAQAETALVALEGVLADFELSLNPHKTAILELPQPILDHWVGEMSTFPIRQQKALPMLSDTIAYFSRAFEIASRGGHGAIRYALLRSRTLRVRRQGWSTFEGLILTSATAEPSTMPVVVDLLNYHSKRLRVSVDKDAVAEVLESQIQRHAPMRNGSEVAWALWAAVSLDVDLSSDAATAVSAVEDDLVALLALDAQAKGRFPSGGLNTTLWDSLASAPDALFGEHWLLAYESAGQQWLPGGASAVAADPFFSVLDGAGVRFYDTSPQRKPFTGPAAPLPGGHLSTASI